MEIDGEGGDIDQAKRAALGLAVGLTLQCHPAMACFGGVHGLRGSLGCPHAVSAGLGIIRFKIPQLPSLVSACCCALRFIGNT